MVSVGNVWYFTNEIQNFEEYSSLHSYDLRSHCRLDFFVFTTSTGMVIVLVGFLLFITGLHERFNGIQAVS